MYGWRGKVLRVDLSRGKLNEGELNPQMAKDYIGGRGLGIHYLLQEVDLCCDPLGKENLLIMAAGSLTGTPAPSGCRYMVVTNHLSSGFMVQPATLQLPRVMEFFPLETSNRELSKDGRRSPGRC